jgi:hypothetical protein
MKQPLIVKAPPASDQDGVKIDSEPDPKKLKSKQDFDMNRLLSPLDVPPPTKPSKPEFTCSEGWLDNVEVEILAQLESSDHPTGSERIPPMAVVRCSRGGKTRALYEIANKMHECRPSRGRIAAIYVTFNDFSSIQPDEQHDPLQALCQRIAFAALKDPLLDEDNKARAFEDFRSQIYDIRPKDIEKWIGSSRVILIIDELNNLTALTDEHSETAKSFGNFVKRLFIQPRGRYFVFSSHVLSTVATLGEFLDTGSARHVTLQELPLVDSLSTAMKHLHPSLHGAREAIYYGLMPGMVYETANRKVVAGKRAVAMRHYKESAIDVNNDFKNILCSLFSGDVEKVPSPLHILLDACGEPGWEKIRWVPFHLEYVMKNLPLRDAALKLATELGELCKHLSESKESSGDGWEAVFVLFLLARCIIGATDEFLPGSWFETDPLVKFNSSYFNLSKPLSDCKNWEDLKQGIEGYLGRNDDHPRTVSVFFPSHAKFERYDVIAVYSDEGKIKDVYGYQLKEGKANSKYPVEKEFTKSFVVKGCPPGSSTTDRNGWHIPCGVTIDKFFGESGKHWTPQEWVRLSATNLQQEQVSE